MQCPRCGEHTPGTLSACARCGAPVAPADQRPDPSQAQHGNGAASSLEATMLDPLSAPLSAPAAPRSAEMTRIDPLGGSNFMGLPAAAQDAAPAPDPDATQAWTMPPGDEDEPAQPSPPVPEPPPVPSWAGGAEPSGPIVPDSWFAEPRPPDPLTDQPGAPGNGAPPSWGAGSPEGSAPPLGWSPTNGSSPSTNGTPGFQVAPLGWSPGDSIPEQPNGSNGAAANGVQPWAPGDGTADPQGVAQNGAVAPQGGAPGDGMNGAQANGWAPGDGAQAWGPGNGMAAQQGWAPSIGSGAPHDAAPNVPQGWAPNGSGAPHEAAQNGMGTPQGWAPGNAPHEAAQNGMGTPRGWAPDGQAWAPGTQDGAASWGPAGPQQHTAVLGAAPADPAWQLQGGQPGPGGYPGGDGTFPVGGFQESQPRSGGRSTNKTLAIAVGVLVTVALVAVTIVMWPDGGDGASAGASTPATPRKAAQNTQKKPPAKPRKVAPQTLEQAKAVNILLDAGADTRNILARALNAAAKCETLPAAVSGFQAVAQRRTNQINRTNGLRLNRLRNGERLRTALRRSFQLSLQTDQAFLAWAQAAQGCQGSPPRDADYARGNTLSAQATTAKRRFTVLWNPIARDTGQPVRSDRQF